MAAHVLDGGFAEPALDAARTFRAAMEAMARPGRIHEVRGASPPASLSTAAGALLLTLCDGTTPLHLAGASDTDAVRAWIAFHCGSPIVRPDAATFALGTWEALQPFDRFPLGLPAYPDRSATLIVEMATLTAEGALLTGPGIEHEAHLSLPGPAEAFQANAALFPLGLDFFLTSGNRLAALPRTTRVA